jgi:hypothetical protein
MTFSGRWRWVGGAGELLMLAYAVPLVILAIGLPVALVIRIVMWMARAF